MKILRFIGFAFLLISLLFTVLPFQSCNPDDDINKDCDTCIVAYKPNIYIYPTEKIQLQVNIDFPLGGKIVKSIPTYGEGWDVAVDPSGLIDNYYTYLFYESSQPDIWQQNEGWTVSQSDLEKFFRNNMKEYGLEGQEIEDFIDYWIPKLKESEFYNIYPQQNEIIDKAISLNFSIEPDGIYRLFYLIHGIDEKPKNELVTPLVKNEMNRNDFVVVEWGVVLK